MKEPNQRIKETIIDQIEQDLKTDLNDLDAVWTTQPLLMMKYAAKQAGAERICLEEKQRIEGLEAAIYNVVRSVRSMNGTKSSESAIDAMVSQIERHYSGEETELNLNTSFIEELPEKVIAIAHALASARHNYNHNKELADLFKAAIEAFRHRRDMIVQASKKATLDYEYLNAGIFTGKK
ncbi:MULTISPECIES: hypothetical protein [Xenorhabdus]|uniref:hypothetical protein n=1 Tax=Xenorhabdus TaxID=626 RepID=UPI00064B2991|nr:MULTISPECIES: hypothetical protein [Xenorhabdus]KLU17193.1 hypothetical protein AAY47_01915 [Xenorhabdus griffiniae]KOP32731.1 hypothetical protein AFK69_13540 [Xenorhabdus sp. GDc328]